MGQVSSLRGLCGRGRTPFDLRKALAGGATKANTLARIIARAQETLVLRDATVKWIGELVPGEKVCVPYKVPNFGFGVGLWEAPRGALGHWVRIENGKIKNYQVITPTAWNVGPRDEKGQPGPIEQALVGVPETDFKSPWNVIRAVHSFDPCLSCTGTEWREIQYRSKHIACFFFFWVKLWGK